MRAPGPPDRVGCSQHRAAPDRAGHLGVRPRVSRRPRQHEDVEVHRHRRDQKRPMAGQSLGQVHDHRAQGAAGHRRRCPVRRWRNRSGPPRRTTPGPGRPWPPGTAGPRPPPGRSALLAGRGHGARIPVAPCRQPRAPSRWLGDWLPLRTPPRRRRALVATRRQAPASTPDVGPLRPGEPTRAVPPYGRRSGRTRPPPPSPARRAARPLPGGEQPPSPRLPGSMARPR